MFFRNSNVLDIYDFIYIFLNNFGTFLFYCDDHHHIIII